MIRSRKYDTIVAVDPDVTKSGVATLHPKTKKIEVTNMTFPNLLDYLQEIKKECNQKSRSLIVLVEAGWKIPANFHLTKYDNRRTASAKGISVGRNHETGRKIVEMCEHYSMEVFEHYPLRKCWKGTGGKITHKELASFTGIKGRTNQDARDAALLAWNFSGLPIRVKC